MSAGTENDAGGWRVAPTQLSRQDETMTYYEPPVVSGQWLIGLFKPCFQRSAPLQHLQLLVSEPEPDAKWIETFGSWQSVTLCHVVDATDAFVCHVTSKYFNNSPHAEQHTWPRSQTCIHFDAFLPHNTESIATSHCVNLPAACITNENGQWQEMFVVSSVFPCQSASKQTCLKTELLRIDS